MAKFRRREKGKVLPGHVISIPFGSGATGMGMFVSPDCAGVYFWPLLKGGKVGRNLPMRDKWHDNLTCPKLSLSFTSQESAKVVLDHLAVSVGLRPYTSLEAEAQVAAIKKGSGQ